MWMLETTSTKNLKPVMFLGAGKEPNNYGSHQVVLNTMMLSSVACVSTSSQGRFRKQT